MREKRKKEWFIDVPWGKLAMVSWGESSQPPVLLVHGYVDTAATFIPLVQMLPDTFYYVAFDLPGHGLSDPVPGPVVSYVHFADVIRQISERMGWDTFVCIAHSMGYLISGFYNAAFPGKISKLVNLDGSVGFGLNAMSDLYDIWYELCYARYYSNQFPPRKQVTYTYDDAIGLLMKARGITEEQAAILATRCMAAAGDGTYRLLWDTKAKNIATTIFTTEFVYAIFGTLTPSLNVVASKKTHMDVNKAFTKIIVNNLQRDIPNYLTVNVEGDHNVHFTHPELLVEFIIEFLNTDFNVRSKL